MNRAAWLLGGLLLAAATLVAPATVAMAYGPSGPTLQLNHSTVSPGENEVIFGSGFDPGETIVLTIDGITVATAQADPDGNFTESIKIPSTLVLGVYSVTATGQKSGMTASTAISVVAAVTSAAGGSGAPVPAAATAAQASAPSPPAPVTSAGSLAFTGADIEVMAAVGGAAICTGGFLVLSTRRRRLAASRT